MSDGADLIPRRSLDVVRDLAMAARVVIVNGPRQVGKSSLLRMLTAETAHARYVSLDDVADLRFARTDPGGFVDTTEPLFVDEVQRGGDPLVLAIKSRVDRSDERGQFILAGSTRFLTEPRLSESLTGRARFLDLWPLAQGEIDRIVGGDTFVDRAFAGTDALLAQKVTPARRRDIFARVCRGGFPEAVRAKSERNRLGFFADYVRTLSQRDIIELSRLARRVDVSTVLGLLAERTAGELNISALANAAGLGAETARRYLPLLEAVFLVQRLPAWGASVKARSRRRPKLHLVDSGLAAYFLGLSEASFERGGDPAAGPLLETFVVNEVRKQLAWSDTFAEIGHWRDLDQHEVDLVVEGRDRRIVAVEVKAAIDVHEHDLRHLAYLRDRAPERFVVGVLLHCGDRARRFGDRLISLPLTSLWEP